MLFSDVIEDVTDQHAVIINRNRQASMLMPGETLLVYEMTPALFATVAANAAEKVAPDVTLVDVSMIGAAGRVYMSGSTADVLRARDEITRVLDDGGGTRPVSTHDLSAEDVAGPARAGGPPGAGRVRRGARRRC